MKDTLNEVYRHITSALYASKSTYKETRNVAPKSDTNKRTRDVAGIDEKGGAESGEQVKTVRVDSGSYTGKVSQVRLGLAALMQSQVQAECIYCQWLQGFPRYRLS
jgi:hypothetical protein